MKILALEFSPPQRSIALLDGDVVLGFAVEKIPKGTRALGLIQELLASRKMTRDDVECIAVGLGPGSYAGIRTAIAIAQGWQLARDVKLVGVSSAEVIARRAQTAEGMAELGWGTPFAGIANIVCDAQRTESYAIQFDLGANQPRAISQFRLLTLEEEARRRDAGERFIKADPGPWRFGEEPVLLADARYLGLGASARRDFVPGRSLEPVYLRPLEFLKAPAARFSANA